MANSLATQVAASDFKRHKMIEDSKLFDFDHTGINAANELSLRDWREWIPLVRPPFADTWTEWSPRDYITPINGIAFDPVEREGFQLTTTMREIIINGAVVSRVSDEREEPMGAWYVKFAKNVIVLPLFVIFAPENPKDKWGIESADWLWGPAYVAKWGRPPDFLVTNLESNRDFLKEFAGLLRVSLAQIALINMERERQVYPESYRSGRTSGLKGRSIPAYRPSVITLRPDAPRFYKEGKITYGQSGVKMREHDVRGHWRQLPGRRIWVKDHQRGDAELGRVNSTYRIAQAPAVILDSQKNEEPNDELS